MACKPKKQPLVWKLEWDILAVIDNPDMPPMAMYKGDAHRLFGQHNIPRNWSVTLAATGMDQDKKLVRRAYSYHPDGKLFLGELMKVVQDHVDKVVWDACADLDEPLSVKALAVTKRV